MSGSGGRAAAKRGKERGLDRSGSAVRDQPLSFLHYDELVRLDGLEHLPRSIGELKLDRIRLRRLAQPEECLQLGLAAEAGAGADPAGLAAAAGGDRHLRADAAPVLSGGDRLHLQPGILVTAVVAKEGRTAVTGGRNEIRIAVIVEVAGRQ